MNDDQLLSLLRHDLDEFVGEPGPAPALTRTSDVPSSRPDRRPWMLVGVAAATVAIVVAGLVLITRRDEPEVGDTPLPGATKPVPPTPDGWTVLEWGDVRLSLPPDLDPFAGGCGSVTKEIRTDPVSRSVTLDCTRLGFSIRPAIDPGFLDASTDVEVNGLSQHRNDGECANCDVTQSVLVRDLTLDVLFHDQDTELAWAIADTIGVSSAWRAANEPAPPVPDDWQAVEYHGVTVRVPADWPTTELTADVADPDLCQYIWRIPDGVTVGLGNLANSTMYCAAPAFLGLPSDGVRMYDAPADGMTPVDNLPAAERVVRGTDDRDVVVRVGFGVDGTIGHTILGSITGPEGVTPPTPSVTVPTTGPTTVPVTEPTAPTTTAPVTAPVTAPTPEYEAIGTVIDTGVDGPMLCFATLDSLPPQCGGGVPLDSWSWDLVDGEREQADVTWLDGVWVRGGYDASASASLAVTDAHVATDADRDRMTGAPTPEPDFSVPCAEPPDGWPARNAEWPAEQIEAIPGFAGAWPDVTGQVVTVKFTGDLAAAREAVEQYYPDALCVVGAERSADDLSRIATDLRALSSVMVFSTVEMVDATGEWVEVMIVAPNPTLQAALDEQYGAGTVRLRSSLIPVPTP